MTIEPLLTPKESANFQKKINMLVRPGSISQQEENGAHLRGLSSMCVFSLPNCLHLEIHGYVSLQHNSLKDTFEELMRTVKCNDVQTEPVLFPVDGQELPKGTVLGDQARLDIYARSIWNASRKGIF